MSDQSLFSVFELRDQRKPTCTASTTAPSLDIVSKGMEIHCGTHLDHLREMDFIARFAFPTRTGTDGVKAAS